MPDERTFKGASGPDGPSEPTADAEGNSTEMKIKLTPDGHAFVIDGKPIYVHDDGKEIAFDALGTAATITRLNGEAKANRERAEAAEGKFKPFEGMEDADAHRKAFELVKNIDEGKLLSAGKVEEIKSAAKKAAEEQVAAANRTHADELARTKNELEKVTGALYGEKIGGAFARSKFFADEKTPAAFKFAIPPDMVQARFGSAFKIEDGKTVAYDTAGNKIFSRARPGDLADFDEALETLVDQYPYKAQILRGSGASGGGAGASHQSAGGKKTITRAQYDALDPMAKASAAIAAGKGDAVITD